MSPPIRYRFLNRYQTMNKRKIQNILLILLPLLAVILHALPTAVVYRVYLGSGYVLRQASGFDRTIVGYGAFLPYLAGIDACICVACGVLRLRETDLRFTQRLRSFALCGAILRNVGVKHLTLEGLLTTILLICVFLIANSIVQKESGL